MKIIIAIFLAIVLYGDVKEDMLKHYKNNNYEEACNLGHYNLNANKSDENYLSLYAFSCLKSDYLTRLLTPMSLLKRTPESRANSAYFSTIIMQKKLLYHALIDGKDLSMLNFPTTDYVLSKVFDLYVKLAKHKARAFYMFEDPDDKRLTYKLYLKKGDKFTKMIIEEYYDKIYVKNHAYW